MIYFIELPREIRNRLYRAVLQELPKIPLKPICCLTMRTLREYQLEEQREAFYAFASLNHQIYDEFITEHALSRSALVSKDTNESADDDEYDQQFAIAFNDTFYMRTRIAHTPRFTVPLRISITRFGETKIIRTNVVVKVFKNSSHASNDNIRGCFSVYMAKPFHEISGSQQTQDLNLLDRVYNFGRARFERVVEEMVKVRIQDDGCIGFTLEGVNKLIALANEDLTAAYDQVIDEVEQ